ncbi:MAG: hypothetical protein V7603_2265 [Micromonosporaceae bacterium]
MHLCIRYAKTAATRAVAIAARLLATSCIVALTYVTTRAILVINAEPHTHVAYPDLAVSQILISLAICIVVASLAVPALAAPLLTPARLPSRSHQYRQLHPLWLTLYQAIPEIALHPPRHSERNSTRPATTHAWSLLYRRLIEIHDGLRRIQPYNHPACSPRPHNRQSTREQPGMAHFGSDQQGVGTSMIFRTGHVRPAAPSKGRVYTNRLKPDTHHDFAGAWLNPVLATAGVSGGIGVCRGFWWHFTEQLVDVLGKLGHAGSGSRGQRGFEYLVCLVGLASSEKELAQAVADDGDPRRLAVVAGRSE